MKKTFFARWRGSFITGLAVTLPAVISIAAILWLFKTVSNLTDALLFFLPTTVTHMDGGKGPVWWYWSLVALLLAIGLITGIGVLARYYIGKRIIEWVDTAMMNVPLLNKIYGALKQVNEAFSGSKTSFKTVVMVEFPREGIHSVGFITNDQPTALRREGDQKSIVVFIPTTPNPTSGFLIVVPEDKVTKLDISVPEGIKYVVSLGSLSPDGKTYATSPGRLA